MLPAWDLFPDAIASSAGSTASVSIAAATVGAAVVEVEGMMGLSGGGEHGGRCVYRNRCLYVKAAYSIRRKGSDYSCGCSDDGKARFSWRDCC